MMRYALLTLALVVPLTAASAQAKKPGAHTQRAVTVALPDQMTWGPAPAVLPAGAKLVVLEGDPTKSGAFTMRLLMPDGYQISPHFHPATEHVTVVSGALLVGMGEKCSQKFVTQKAPWAPANARATVPGSSASAATTSTPAAASAFAFAELTFRVSARGLNELLLSAIMARTRPPPCAPVAPMTAMIFLSAMTILPC